MKTDHTAPYHGFRGRIERTMARSEPAWPAMPTAPDGAPNIVVVLVDDVGFSDLGCYGGEIATPHIDRLAAEGVRFTRFHVNPMCSPTRAALLTGVNAHRAGVGHVAQDDPGFPGYYAELAPNVATVAEILREHGYATLMAGKWHLCRDSDVSAYGPMTSWPCQRGFQRFYGILDAFTNLHQPAQLAEDNHPVEVDRYPDGYYLTDDLTDWSIARIRERKAANPLQPFFLYLAHPAAHAPLMAVADDVERYRDTYGVGWDEIRRRRHQRQLELGIIPPGTPLPPRNAEPGDEVPAWDDLSDVERQVYARYMAVYAAMIDRVDQNLGRLRTALEEMGEWDRTVVLFLSDNGASREGEATGTTNYYAHLAVQAGGDAADVSLDAARLDDIGTARTTCHYPRGWAMASNTPFRLYKRNTHAGGHQVPAIWRLGAAVPVSPGGLRHQYAHCVDVVPTLLELAGVPAPIERDGCVVKEMDGTSLAGVLRDPDHAEVRSGQYYELEGHRGLYADGWEVVTNHRRGVPFDDAEWELYDLHADPVELTDLARERPDLVRELSARFDAEAHRNQVYPLDELSGWRWIVRRPHDEVFAEPVTLWPGTPTLERWRSSRLLWQRTTTITIVVAVADGDRGMLLAHGDQGGGYAVYVDGGHVHYVSNDGHGHTNDHDAGELAPGEHQVVLVIEAPGGWRWNVRLSVDGEARLAVDDLPMLFPMAPFEGIDVGIDRRSPVSWPLYERNGPFPYTGTLRWVRIEPGEPAPDAPQRFVELARQIGAAFD
jgi:arylsulfatase